VFISKICELIPLIKLPFKNVRLLDGFGSWLLALGKEHRRKRFEISKCRKRSKAGDDELIGREEDFTGESITYFTSVI